jgi:hypothetical protein
MYSYNLIGEAVVTFLASQLQSGFEQPVTICHWLKMVAEGGKQRDCYVLYRSIPSKKAEPFKQWLVGGIITLDIIF